MSERVAAELVKIAKELVTKEDSSGFTSEEIESFKKIFVQFGKCDKELKKLVQLVEASDTSKEVKRRIKNRREELMSDSKNFDY